MNTSVFSHAQGIGPDLVLLHGWGVNSGVWEPLVREMSANFRLTCIDLPGFGRSIDCLPEQYDLASLSNLLLPHIPANSIIMGWSLGGLVANQIAIEQQVALRGVISVASSPKFVAENNWPGMAPDVLQLFAKQLEGDFNKTLERFLAIQALGSPSARKDSKILKQSINQYPTPCAEALYGGLDILQTADIRADLAKLNIPVLNCYGKLDSLVPSKVHSLISDLYTNSPQTQVFSSASHAPFISDPDRFTKAITEFVHSISP
ncbi:pimeloyl-ACP methyl ester esterase BioH [Neptunicella sp.]|uniref:pimeloyl-ACP methyl ester esterase BioH n=1 Tax=Neptunicella sp. TaxID=2125986 RepID=UPI003F68E22C